MHNMLGLITLFYFIFLSIGVPQARAVTGCEGAALLEPQGSYSGSFANKPFKWRQNSATWVMVQIFSGTTQNYVFQTWYEAATICDGTTCSVTPGKNFLPGDYYWWLNTYSDTCNFQMQVGGIFLSFTIAVDPCTNPVLSAPSGPVLTISPAFKFSKTLAQWVQLQVSAVATGKICYSQWFDAAQVCTAAGCTIQPTTQFGPANYAWWVNTYSDACGYQYQPGGTVAAFTVESCSNTPMTLTAPAQGSYQLKTPTFIWKKAGNFDYYQLNTYSISTNTKSFSTTYSTADICTATTCTVTIPGTTPLPVGDTYWWLNASSPTCGFVSQPGGNLGYFKVAPASAKDITSFILKKANNTGLTTDVVGTITVDTVELLVPSTAKMSALVPTIETIPGSSINPPSGSAQAFTDNVSKTYTVTAADGSTKNYHVTVIVMTIKLTDPLNGALRTQTPTFTWQRESYFDIYQVNTWSISTNTKSFSKSFDAAQICGGTSCTVTIPAETPLPNGDTYWWLNTSGPVCGFQSQPGGNLGYFKVDPAGATAKDITSFVFRAADNPGLPSDVTGTIGTNTVDLTVPYGTSLSALVPTITITGSSVNPASRAAQAFTDEVGKTYTVTSADGTTKHYTVTVTVAPNPAKDITSFVLQAADNPGLPSDVTGTIGTNTVDLTVPYGTDLSALVPTITITGDSVNPASGVAQGFFDGLGETYTVTAADSTTKAYTVTVHYTLNPAKNITSFIFSAANNPGLASDVTGTVDTNTVDLIVPYGTNLSALVPTITITGSSVAPASGIAQAFTDGVGKSYKVTAADGTTKNYTVTVTSAPNPAKDITSFLFQAAHNPGLPSDVTGTIGTNTVDLTVPYGTNLSALVPTIAIAGSSVNPAGGAAQAFIEGVGKTYTVTAADGTTKAYTVTVHYTLNPAKDITSFIFSAANNPVLSSDVDGTIGTNTIDLIVPYGTSLSALVPTITITGSSGSPASGVPQEFTAGVGKIYTVTAADNSTKEYTVTVTALLNPAKDITSFVFRAADNPDLSYDVFGTVGANTVDLTVPYGTDLYALVPTIGITGSSVYPGSGVAQAFTDGVGNSYTVTAANGTSKVYTVTVHVALNPAKDIDSFVFRAVNNPALSADVTGTIGTNTVDLTVPYGTNLSAMVPTITITGSSVNPASGAVQAFTSGVGKTYTVTAANSTAKGYTVTVHVALNPTKDITSFIFTAAYNSGLTSDVTGTVGTNTVNLTVPYGTSLSALVPTITITGSSVNPASGVAQSFTNGVGKTYTVTAADSSTKNYTVTVTVALNPAKNITAFSFTSSANPGKLIDTEIGTINGTNISVTVPPLTVVTGLVATFSITGTSVAVGSTLQTSGTTANNFTNPVIYSVMAADGSTEDYTVTVQVETEAPWEQETNSGIRSWYAIAASADGMKLAAAAYNNYIYTSTNGGLTWTAKTNSGQRGWYSLTSSADGMRLAAGVNSGYIYTSTDGGATWTERTNAGSHAWYSIASSADGMKLAACDYNSGYIYTSINGGATWTQRTTSGQRLWSSIASSADGMKLAACVQNGYLYTSSDGGATWTANTSMGAQFWWSITSSADGQKLAVIAYNGNLCTSHNGGATWTNLGNRGWCAISSSADGTRLAAVVDGGYIYLSTDSGVTWVQQTSAGIRSWDTVAVSGDGSMAAVGDYGNYNGGYIWIGQFPAIETPPVQAASFSVNHASISISDNGTAKSYIMTRTDITNEVGGFNGGGRGNKNILGITGYSGLPLSEFASVSFSTNAMGTGNNIYLNMIIDLDGDVTTVGDRKILTASDASGNFPGDIVTAHVGGGASEAGNVQNYPAGQYDLRSYLPQKTIWGAVGSIAINACGNSGVDSCIDPGTGLALGSHTTTNQSLDLLKACCPNAVLLDAATGDGGMPKNIVTPSIMIISGDSGSLENFTQEIKHISVDSN